MIAFLYPLLILANSAFAAYDINGTDVRECYDETRLPLFAQINYCEDMPCDIVGEIIIIDVIFHSYKYTENPHAIAIIVSEPFNHILEQENGCEGFTNIRCPLDPGDRVRYHFEISVAAIPLTIPFELTFSLFDDDDEGIFCFELDAQLVEEGTVTSIYD